MKNNLDLWVARDRDFCVFLYFQEPIFDEDSGVWKGNELCQVERDMFFDLGTEEAMRLEYSGDIIRGY